MKDPRTNPASMYERLKRYYKFKMTLDELVPKTAPVDVPEETGAAVEQIYSDTIMSIQCTTEDRWTLLHDAVRLSSQDPWNPVPKGATVAEFMQGMLDAVSKPWEQMLKEDKDILLEIKREVVGCTLTLDMLATAKRQGKVPDIGVYLNKLTAQTKSLSEKAKKHRYSWNNVELLGDTITRLITMLVKLDLVLNSIEYAVRWNTFDKEGISFLYEKALESGHADIVNHADRWKLVYKTARVDRSIGNMPGIRHGNKGTLEFQVPK